MLPPEYLMGVADHLVDVYATVEEEILEDIARRIVKMGYVSEATAWQIAKGKEAGILTAEVQRILSNATGQSEIEILRLLGEAGTKALSFDDAIYKLAGLSPIPMGESPALKAILLQGSDDLTKLLGNFTQTRADMSQLAFRNLTDAGQGCNTMLTWGGVFFNMTNEELAVMIQNGHTELYTDLWEQVYRLVCMKAERYSHQLQENGWRMDPEDFIGDLIQSGYFALVNAVKYFEPNEDIKFNTYLGNTLKSAFREAVGIRSSKRDSLEFSISLDAPVLDDGDTALLDLIDSRPYYGYDMVKVEDSVYLWELRAALDEALSFLNPKESDTLRKYYFYGINYADQAELCGVSRQYLTELADSAMEKLRNNRRIMKNLAGFMPDYEYDPYKFTGYSSWSNSALSAPERYIMGGCDNQNGVLSLLL